LSKSPSHEILRDLFALYSKYGKAEIEKAINELESGDSGRILAKLSRRSLEAFSTKNSDVLGRSRRRSSRDRLEEFLSRLAADDDGKKQIRALVAEIAGGRSLAGPKALGSFATQLGISAGKKIDRLALAQRIGETLAQKSESEIEQYVKLAHQLERRKSSLDEWSKIIVKG